MAVLVRFRFAVRIAGLTAIAFLAACTSRAQEFAVESGDGLAVTLSPQGQVVSLQEDQAELAGSAAPLVVVRDLSTAGSVFQPNLLPNPGFENGTASWHEVQSDGVHGVLVGDSTHSGGWALELSGGSEDEAGWAAWAADPVAVTPGERLRVGAWWKSPEGFLVEGSGTPPALQLEQWRRIQGHTGLYVQWLDGSGAPLGEPALAVALHTNCSTWRLTRRELMVPAGASAARVIVGAKLLGETVVVDDLSLVGATEPEVAVSGTVGPCGGGDCIELTGTGPGGLGIDVRLTAGSSSIEVAGTVTDSSGRERACDLTVQVPLDADDGWDWWDDTHTSRPVTGRGRYEHVVSAVSDGWLPVSLYPYGGLASAAAGAGLALALPPDRPQLGEIAYDGERHLLGVTFHLGISPHAVHLNREARFAAVLYRTDPIWGFRDIIRRYRDLFPAAFRPQVPLYGFNGRSQGGYSTPAGVAQVRADDAANIYSAEYTSCDLPIKVTPSTNPRPALDEVLDVVEWMAESPDEPVRALAGAIQDGAVVDTNGEWFLKHVMVPVWNEGWWEACWIGDMDPDIGGGLAAWNLHYRIDAAFAACAAAGARLDGVQIDNFMSTPTFDLRPEALEAADETLGYSPNTYQPAVHTGFAVREYLEWLRHHLDTAWGTDRAITINFWGLAHPNYLAPLIDGFGSEGNIGPGGTGLNWNLEILDYRRAIADRRPYLFTNQTVGLTAEQARLFVGPAILFGVPSGVGPNGHDWEPEAEREVERAAELVFSFWAAGWEPVTLARADDPEILMERFGRAGSPADSAAPAGIFFTVYNPGETRRRTTVSVDLVELGLAGAAGLRLTDLETGEPLPFVRSGGFMSVSLTLPPGRTRVLRLLPLPLPRRPAGRVGP